MSETTTLRSFGPVLRAVYDAALAPEHWPEALSRIGGLFGGEGAVIVFYRENEPADFIACPELVPAVEVYQAGGWWKRDLHAQRAIALNLAGGDVFNDALVASPDEIRSHPIYVEFFRQVGFGWLMSCVLLPDLDMLICLSVPRAKEKGAFRADEMELLRHLGGHVEQALRVSLRIASLEAENATCLAALDAVDGSLYALDEDGRVAFMNRDGEMSRGNYFLDDGDRLLPRVAAERRQFEARITAAHRAAEDAFPTPCVITGRDGRRMALWALPVTDASRVRIGEPRAPRILLFGTALDRDRAIDPAVLRDVFSLSLGEARLASLLGAGLDMREAAARLGVTEGTARIVLKRVFRKLGVNRQAQLVRQLSHLGGWGSIGVETSSSPCGHA